MRSFTLSTASTTLFDAATSRVADARTVSRAIVRSARLVDGALDEVPATRARIRRVEPRLRRRIAVDAILDVVDAGLEARRDAIRRVGRAAPTSSSCRSYALRCPLHRGRRAERRRPARVTLARVAAHRRPVAVLRADVVRPAATKIGFDRVEVASAIVRIPAREVSELIRRSHVIERAICRRATRSRNAFDSVGRPRRRSPSPPRRSSVLPTIRRSRRRVHRSASRPDHRSNRSPRRRARRRFRQPFHRRSRPSSVRHREPASR